MKFKKLVCTLLTLSLGVFALASCTGGDGDGEELNYVSLRINPEIELLCDNSGEVVSVNAVNEDGEIVLESVDLMGMDIADASATFAEAADDLGYVNEDGSDNTVFVGVEGEGSLAIEEKVNKNIRSYFDNNGINGKVSKETLDKYADKAAEWGVSNGHVKLIMRALDANPDLTDADVIHLEVKDIMKLIKSGNENGGIAAGLKAEYRAAVEALKLEYVELFDIREEIDAYEEALEGELTDEERAAVEAALEALEKAEKPLAKAYKADLDELKDNYKKLSKDARTQYRAEAEKKIKDKAEKDKSKDNKKDK